jgi:hypothetical protein
MHEPESRSNRAAWLWPLATSVVMLGVAATLCFAGYAAMIEDYDGAPSLFNALTIGAWCGAAMLVLTVAPITFFVHDTFRDRGGR